MSSVYDWHRRAFCKTPGCTFNEEPSFGDLWFLDTSTPVCPKCGEYHSYYLKTVRLVDVVIEVKKFVWYKPNTWLDREVIESRWEMK